MNIIKYAKTKLNKDLTNEQINLINSIDKNTAGIAVPGSGKTTVFTLRVGKLLFEKNVCPENLLLLTFSKSSANDMRDRFEKYFPKDIFKYDTPIFRTIHSFSFSILKAHDKNFSIDKIIEDEKKNINKKTILKNIHSKFSNEFFSEEIYNNLVNKISYCKNKMIFPNGISDTDSEFKNIYNEYELIKKANDLYDYDDLLDKAYKLLNTNTKIREILQEKYKYIQIDEYQDTSILQNALISLIFNPQKNNLFVVGDDDQSIYKFRGADISEFLKFEETIPNSKVLTLNHNFRSSKEIIDYSSCFISQNKHRYKKNIIAVNNINSIVEIVELDSQLSQVRYVIDKLRIYNNKKNAILYRNNISAILFISELIKNNISFQSNDLNVFFSQKSTRDILLIINYSFNTADISLFKQIAKLFFIPNKFVKHLEYKPSYQDCLEFLINEFDNNKFLREDYKIYDRIKVLYTQFNNLKNKETIESIDYICNTMGYNKYLNKIYEDNPTAKTANIFNIEVLKALASEHNTIESFTSFLNELKNGIKNTDSSDNPVILKTIHSSKGLEWDNVFIVDLIQNIFPAGSSIKNIILLNNYEDYEEERRLMYVAMTRAKENLYIISPAKNEEKNDSSIFLSEIIEMKEDGFSHSIQHYVNLEKNKIKKRKKVQCNTNKIETIEPLDKGDLFVGQEITHVKLGKGKIINITSDYKTAEIKFEAFPIPKKMLLAFLKNNII